MRGLFVFAIAMLIATGTYSQLISSYQFNDEPASGWLGNPSYFGQERFYIGIPALNGIEINGAHTGFTFANTVDNETISFNSVLNELDDVNHLMTSNRIGILNGGFRIGNNWHVRIGAQAVIEARIGYPKSLFELLYKGNGHPDLIGTNVDMSGLAFNSLLYTDYYVGFSRNLMDGRLVVGANVHYLQGIAANYTERSEFSLFTDADTYAISLNGAFTYHTNLVGDSATFDIAQDAEEFGDSFGDADDIKLGQGAAVDFGVRYKLLEDLELQASALNIGGISWSENTATYELGGSFTYSGVELEDFLEDPDSAETAFEALADSLSNAFTSDNSADGFSIPTNARFILGANYAINDRSDVNVAFGHLRSFGEGFNTVSAVYRRKFGRIFWIHGGVQLFEFSDPLIPAGFHVNAGPLQIGLGTNNLIAAFAPTRTGYFTGQLNMALRFGRDHLRRRSAEE
ncbi:MAG: hypothetical protein HRT74_09730 [Flavobacteriales bacterium]|nr:hypothetical protein [Flavobacteriales bacterium]